MKLKLNRKWFTDKSTIGILYVDGVFFCYTLEDIVRPAGEKIKGKTAIPWGNYSVVITHSNRFNKPLPLLLSVPYFGGIRIHAGNTSENTEGCILVGASHAKDFVGSSKVAMDKLMDVLYNAYARRDVVTLEISAEATT